MVSAQDKGLEQEPPLQQAAVLLANEITERCTLCELLVPKELNHKALIALRK